MRVNVISFYDKFNCLMSDCPDTCCRGWRVSVDDDCLSCHEQNVGFDKFKSFILLDKKNQKFRTFMGLCPYETRDGLCAHHKRNRQDLMPRICRTFPRRIITFRDETEVTFELSCPMTAKLFLEAETLSFTESKEEIEQVWVIDDHDPQFLLNLKAMRRRMISYVYEAKDFLSCLDNLYIYVLAIHYNLMFNKYDVINMEIDDVLSMLDSIDVEKESWAKKPKYYYDMRKERKNALFYNMADYDKMFSEDVCHEYSRAKFLLKKYIKRYNRCIGQMSVSLADGQVFFQYEKMLGEHPALLDKYSKYLIYQFMQTITSCYENYGMLRAYMHSMINLQSMMIMDICDYLSGEDLTDVNRQVKLLVALEKTHRHNLTTTDNLMKRISRIYF